MGIRQSREHGLILKMVDDNPVLLRLIREGKGKYFNCTVAMSLKMWPIIWLFGLGSCTVLSFDFEDKSSQLKRS